MKLADFHVHSTFSDGRNTPEEIVRYALDRGFYAIGITDHSPMPHEKNWPIRHEWAERRKEEIARLRHLYGDKIEILTGIELDSYCDISRDGYDYIISSLHWLKFGEEYSPTDWDPRFIREAADKYFGGDVYAYAEEYFRQASTLADEGTAVIGHFDVIAKHNEDGSIFDEGCDRFLDAAKAAVDVLLSRGAMFEINTGNIFRGYRSTPFPGRRIMEYLAEKGARVIITGDAHSVDALCHGFGEAREIARDAGIEVFEKYPQKFVKR